jgi:pyruvate formate lyase activating enzyme
VDRGFWVEVVTLVVPGFNDSREELTDIARFLASVSPDLPWHVTGFHKDYKMTSPGDTPAETLGVAREIGHAAGLHFVYAGNRPGQLAGAEDTTCPSCAALLIQRHGYTILANRMNGSSCPDCGTRIPGIWRPPETTDD